MREWEEDGVVVRVVRYFIGSFKDKPAWMAAFYAAPKGRKQLPGVLHMHGGGQRANLNLVKYHAGRGYAALSVNWGGRPMEGAKPGEANTDWGAVDPTQNNVRGYFNLQPGDKFLDAQDSPRNYNWFLLVSLSTRADVSGTATGGGRQTAGHSGGAFDGWQSHDVRGGHRRAREGGLALGGRHGLPAGWIFPCAAANPAGDGRSRVVSAYDGVSVLRAAHSGTATALGASNDFHGQMDATYATGARVPKEVPQRFVFAPHFNHRFNPAEQVARILWLDQHLKGGVKLPDTPQSEFGFGKTAVLYVDPAKGLPVKRVEIYYSVDPDPRSRFWRSAGVLNLGGHWQAELELETLARPLFAFANVYYALPKPVALPHHGEVTEVCISSQLHVLKSKALKATRVRPMGGPEFVIDDFKNGFRDWYTLNGNHRPLWQHWTRKVTDPKWRGPQGAKLALTIQSEQPNVLGVVLHENTWRQYRGKKRTYVAEMKLKGGKPETVSLALTDFKNVTDGEPLKNWEQLDELGLVAKATLRGPKPVEVAADPWQGPRPVFKRLEWVLPVKD